MSLIFDRKHRMRAVLILVLMLSALILGACDNSGGSGLWQGGGDSAPSWR